MCKILVDRIMRSTQQPSMISEYRVSCMYGLFSNIKNIIKEFKEGVAANINNGD